MKSSQSRGKKEWNKAEGDEETVEVQVEAKAEVDEEEVAR